MFPCRAEKEKNSFSVQFVLECTYVDSPRNILYDTQNCECSTLKYKRVISLRLLFGYQRYSVYTTQTFEKWRKWDVKAHFIDIKANKKKQQEKRYFGKLNRKRKEKGDF